MVALKEKRENEWRWQLPWAVALEGSRSAGGHREEAWGHLTSWYIDDFIL